MSEERGKRNAGLGSYQCLAACDLQWDYLSVFLKYLNSQFAFIDHEELMTLTRTLNLAQMLSESWR